MVTKSTGLRNRSSSSFKPDIIVIIFCYIAFPLGAVLFRLGSNADYFRLWLDFAWIILIIVLIGTAIARNVVLPAHKWLTLFAPIGALYILIVRLVSVSSQNIFVEFLVVPIELKLLLYTFLATLISTLGHRSSPKTWQRAGFWLGIVIVIDTLAETIKNGEWTRPQGSGEVNYEALLLAISLAFSIYTTNSTLGARIKHTWVPLLALILTQSRTMLLASFILYFVLSPSNRIWRLTVLVLGVGALLVAFQIRGLELTIDTFDRYWMWVAGTDALSDISIFLSGITPGVPLPTEVPEAVADLWQQQTANFQNPGVYPFNFHAFWLRFAITYGVPATALVLYFSISRILSKFATTPERHLHGLLLLAGFTMGTLYLTNIGVPFLLAIHAARNMKRNYHV